MTDYLKAGLSIGIGLLRILFPESQQFLDAKQAGRRSDPKAFWRETTQLGPSIHIV